MISTGLTIIPLVLMIGAILAFMLYCRAQREHRMRPPANWAIMELKENTKVHAMADIPLYSGWEETVGTVISGKAETHDGVRLYYPIFSYFHHGEEYTSSPKSGSTSISYPLGTTETLLVKENNPLEILILPKLKKTQNNKYIFILLGIISASIMLTIRIMFRHGWF